MKTFYNWLENKLVDIMEQYVIPKPNGRNVSLWKRPMHIEYQPYWITLVHMVLGGQRVQVVGSMTVDGMAWKNESGNMVFYLVIVILLFPPPLIEIHFVE